MANFLIKVILIALLVFTPAAFGSMEIWAYSVMELGIFLIIFLAALQYLLTDSRVPVTPHLILRPPAILLCLFLIFLLFQLLPLPAGWVKILSPKTYELRQGLLGSLSFASAGYPLSFYPFATQLEFFKWLALAGFFIFLSRWFPGDGKGRATNHYLMVILLVGVAESFYGMLEFFSGHRHILNLEASFLASSVTGTFINRNYFAGYLLMAIPLSLGLLLARETGYSPSWRQRLSSMDGKTFLIAFGITLMILGLLFSASRMGIVSLLLSFTLITLLSRGSGRGGGFSKGMAFIIGLALLWGTAIGLDAFLSRFFSVGEDFKFRWLMWTNTFQIFKDFPLFGTGLGSFAQVFPLYRSFYILPMVTHAENDFLQLTSDTGIIGAGILATLFGFLLIKAIRGVRGLAPQDPGRYVSIGGLVGVLALMFHSLVERNLQVPANAFLFTFTWALVLNLTRKTHSDSIP